MQATANDPDGNIVSYEWKEGSVVRGNEATLTLQNLTAGTHIYTVTVTDDKGATATDTVVVTVTTPVNHAPQAVSKDLVMYENESIAILLSGSDVDGDVLSYKIVTQPQHGTLSNGVPNVVYTADSGYVGEDSFSYVVNDGTTDSALATVHITIRQKPVTNQAPVPTYTAFTMDEDTTKSDTLTATDADGDALTFAKVSDPAHGTLSIDPNGNFTYVPESDYYGSDSFTYSVSDGKTTVTQVVNITITDVAEPDTTAPVITLNGENPLTLTVGDTYTEPGATANDDRDGAVTVNITGSVDTATAGTYTITYTATDSSGNTAQVTRTVIVEETDNTAPTITSITLDSSDYEQLGENYY